MMAGSEPWRVWVTRAQPGADATAARLRERGHFPIVGSLLQVRALVDAAVCTQGVTTLAFTSANAVRAFAATSSVRALPVMAVGATTAQAAREAGFAEVESSDGDVSALAADIVRARPGGIVLHPCGVETAGDLSGELGVAGVRCESVVVYETLPVRIVPSGVLEALAGADRGAVLLHSPKAARVLAEYAASGSGLDVSRLSAFGLSRSCLAPLADLSFGSVCAAVAPSEAALLELLG